MRRYGAFEKTLLHHSKHTKLAVVNFRLLDS